MMNKLLLTGRGWRLAGWLAAIFFAIGTLYTAAIVTHTLMEYAV